MKTNFNNLLTAWTKQIGRAPVGSFLDMACGGRIERRPVGWFGRDSWEEKMGRMNDEAAAIMAASHNFVRIKRSRKALPLP